MLWVVYEKYENRSAGFVSLASEACTPGTGYLEMGLGAKFLHSFFCGPHTGLAIAPDL